MVAPVAVPPTTRLGSSNEPAVASFDSPRNRTLGSVPAWSGDDRVQTVAAALWDLLPFGKLDLSLDYDRTELARSYADSYQRLEQAGSEMAGMFGALRDTVLVIRQDDRIAADIREDWLRRQREALEQRMRVPFVPPDNSLTFQSAGQHGLAERLLTGLRERVQQFAADLFDSLEGLARHQIVGRIEWVENTDCRFTFQEFAFSQEFVREVIEDRAIFHKPSQRRGLVTESRQVCQNTSSIVRHEHELINARQHQLEQTVFPVPQAVQAFIEIVPLWLRPMLRVVEGTQIKERIGELDVKTELWRSKPKEIDRVLFHNDPALVLHKFVLMGWGQREVSAETERLLGEQATAEQKLSSQRQSENSRLALIVGSGALWSGVGLSLLAFAMHSPLCLYASWGLSLLAVAVSYLGGAMSAAPDANAAASGFVRAGRALLMVLGVQTLLYGLSGVGIGLIGLSAICWLGLAVLRAARKASVSAK